MSFTTSPRPTSASLIHHDLDHGFRQWRQLAQRQRYVVFDGERVEQRRLLEHDAHRPPNSCELALGAPADVHALHENRARLGALQPDDVPDQRRLAGAAASEQHHDLATPDVEVQVIQDALVAVPDGQVANGDEGLLHDYSPRVM
jgi:hypothetical protein